MARATRSLLRARVRQRRQPRRRPSQRLAGARGPAIRTCASSSSTATSARRRRCPPASRHARGEVVVTLDGDGQNDPADMPPPARRASSEVRRRERAARSSGRRRSGRACCPSLVANWLIVLATGVPVYDCGCGLKAYRREVVAGRAAAARLQPVPARHSRRRPQARRRDRRFTIGRAAPARRTTGFSRVVVVLRDLPSPAALVTLAPRPLGPARGRASPVAAAGPRGSLGVGAVARRRRSRRRRARGHAGRRWRRGTTSIGSHTHAAPAFFA